MKDLVIAIILAVVLIGYCSFIDCAPIETSSQDGGGLQHEGESDLIIPGDGDDFAEAEVNETAVETESTSTESGMVETTEVPWEIHNDILKESNSMDGMVAAFWHGVAAVLIGEASAVAVAFAWNKWFREDRNNG